MCEFYFLFSHLKRLISLQKRERKTREKRAKNTRLFFFAHFSRIFRAFFAHFSRIFRLSNFHSLIAFSAISRRKFARFLRIHIAPIFQIWQVVVCAWTRARFGATSAPFFDSRPQEPGLSWSSMSRRAQRDACGWRFLRVAYSNYWNRRGGPKSGNLGSILGSILGSVFAAICCIWNRIYEGELSDFGCHILVWFLASFCTFLGPFFLG